MLSRSTTGILLLATLSVWAVSSVSEARTQLTLPDAVELALRKNPLLRAKQQEHDATRAGETTAGLRPNPTASYSAEQLGSPAVEPQHTVALSQTIETGGKRGRRIESARAATRVSEFELADVRRQVIAQVKRAFTDALTAEATVRLASDNLQSIDELERLSRLRAEKGEIAELELLRIQTQRFAFERDLADARQAVQVGKVALRTTMGPDAIARDFDVAGELAFRDVPLDGDRLLQQSLERRPDVRAAEAGREKARADVNLARANAWWDFAPQVQYQRIGPDNTFGVGISVPLRVFDRNQGEIERTQAGVQRADHLRDAAINQVRSEVESALASVLTEREKVRRLGDLYLPRAERVRATVDFAYRRGGLSVLDLLDAQRTYRETALEHVRALGNYWNAVYQLEAAVGESLEP
jgi:cobalt-zinc-cadmium efflux system outer membrane protein